MSVLQLVHQGLRKEFGLIARAAKATYSEQHRALLDDQLTVCLDMLDRHERLEDSWLFPTIRARAPESSPGIESLLSEHAQLTQLTETIRADRGRLDERAAAIAELDSILGPHIDRENRDIVPFIATVIKQDEWDAFSYQTLNGVPESQLPVVLGWLMSSGKEDQIRNAKSLLPSDVRLRLRFRWMPKYQARVRRLYG